MILNIFIFSPTDLQLSAFHSNNFFMISEKKIQLTPKELKLIFFTRVSIALIDLI